MDFDETELEVAEILLQFPRLIFYSDNENRRRKYPLACISKKPRRFAPLRIRKTLLWLPNSKLRIALKIKRSENLHRNSCTRERSRCVCAVKDGSPKRKKVTQSSESSDLNLALLIKEEEDKKLISPRSVAAHDEDGRNGCCSMDGLLVQVKESLQICD